MASVTVRGTAHLSVAPDRARLDLGLTNVAPSAAAAMGEISARSQQLASLLTDIGLQRSEWSTQGVSLQEEWEWKDNTNTMVGHRATAGITVDLTDLDRLPALVQRAVDEAGAQVRGLQWHVSVDHPAHHALLGAAALDAQRRAIAYTVTLGLLLGAVEEISDLPITVSPGNDGQAMMRAAKGAAEPAPAMDISGGEIALSASVNVRFSTLQRP
jgi:uncharacterized protein YggE